MHYKLFKWAYLERIIVLFRKFYFIHFQVKKIISQHIHTSISYYNIFFSETTFLTVLTPIVQVSYLEKKMKICLYIF